MTQTEIQTLHQEILDLLAARRAKEAIAKTGYLLQQVGFGPLYDKLRDQDTTYKYLLQYNLEGYADNQRDEVLRGIYRQLSEIADQAFYTWMQTYGGVWVYTLMHPSEVKSPEEFVESFRSALDELNQVEDTLKTDPTAHEAIREADKSARKKYETLQSEMFDSVLRSKLWRPSDKWQEAVIQTDNDTQALLVSAMLLSCIWVFDEQKMLLLMELASSAAPKTSMRALTALVLLLDRNAGRLGFYPSLQARFKLLVDDQTVVPTFYTICAQLVRERNVDDLNHRIQEDIMPEMNRFGTLIQQRLSEVEKPTDEIDMEELFEDAHLSDKMQQFQQMQMSGEDVYLSTFSRMKSTPFFKEISHWFTPFNEANAAVSGLFGTGNGDETFNVMQIVTRLGFMCDSDKYAFCSNMLQVPEQYRQHVSSSLGAEGEALRDMLKADENGFSKRKTDWLSNQYIQDLYRFFTLFPNRAVFGNMFEQPFDFFGNVWISEVMGCGRERQAAVGQEGMVQQTAAGTEGMEKVAAAWVRNRHFVLKTRQENCRRAIDIYLVVLKNKPDDYKVLRQIGYCHEQLNELPSAVDYYSKADLVHPDNAWTLKRLAVCCSLLGRHEEALEYYQRLAGLDSENVQAVLNVGHALMELKRYSEALNAYYKAEFLFPDSPKTWRPIAWCSMLLGRLEQAEKYTRNILSSEPTVNDYLNAGHVAWLMGQRRQAVERYVAGIRKHKLAVQDFIPLFDRDVEQMVALGIDRNEVSLVRDGIIYGFEN